MTYKQDKQIKDETLIAHRLSNYETYLRIVKENHLNPEQASKLYQLIYEKEKALRPVLFGKIESIECKKIQ